MPVPLSCDKKEVLHLITVLVELVSGVLIITPAIVIYNSICDSVDERFKAPAITSDRRYSEAGSDCEKWS